MAVQAGVVVRRDHLGVGVDVDARPFGLPEQVVDVLQVVARHEDAGVAPRPEVHPGGAHDAVGGGIGRVEERHRGDVHAPRLEGEGEERVDAPFPRHLGERAKGEGGERVVEMAEDVRVVGVGGDPLQGVGDRLAQGAEVLVARVEDADGVGLARDLRLAGPHPGDVGGGEGRVRPVAEQFGVARDRLALHLDRLAHERRDPLRVEVRVRDRREEAPGDEGADPAVERRPLGEERVPEETDPLQVVDEQVLQVRALVALAAAADLRAALAFAELLALEAEHRHRGTSFRDGLTARAALRVVL